MNPDIHPILTDHLGTPRKVLDASTGQPRWEWDAKEPFGHQAPNQTPTAGLPAFSLDLRFPGQRYDEATGLFQNGFRDYHAGLGRYVQSDPLGMGAGWNTYGYAGGHPNLSIDPHGLDWAPVQYLFDQIQPPPLPQGVVDFSAGWGDTLTTMPFTDFSLTRWIRQENGTADLVNCGSNYYSMGQIGGMVNGAVLGAGGGAGAAIKWGQRGVPEGMVRVTTWGSQSIRSGSWVVMGGPNRASWVLSGIPKVYRYSDRSTHLVPKKSLANPYNHRPSNEPASVAWAKNFIGINMLQRVYRP